MTLDFALTILRDLDRPDADRAAILDERIAELDQASEFLKALKPLVFGGSPPGKPPAALPGQSSGPGKAARSPQKDLPAHSPAPGFSGLSRNELKISRKRAIARKIASDGPLRSTEAMQAANCPPGSICSYLSSAWFQKNADGRYDLTPFGRKQLKASP